MSSFVFIIACVALVSAAPVGAVQITEIFPRATTSSPEWFEVRNGSPDSINLRNWQFGNATDSELVTTTSVVLAPGDYRVITRDAVLFNSAHPAIRGAIQPPHWHTLDNYNDSLMLWDSTGVLIDLALYRSSIFTNWTNQSLQRLDTAANPVSGGLWALASRTSPGQPNPATDWQTASQAALDIGPIPFSPNGDNRDDQLAINVQIPADANLTISIYGFSGLLYYSWSGAPQKPYLWNGVCNNGSNAPTGPFFVVARITTPHGTQIIRKGGVLWR